MPNAILAGLFVGDRLRHPPHASRLWTVPSGKYDWSTAEPTVTVPIQVGVRYVFLTQHTNDSRFHQWHWKAPIDLFAASMPAERESQKGNRLPKRSPLSDAMSVSGGAN